MLPYHACLNAAYVMGGLCHIWSESGTQGY